MVPKIILGADVKEHKIAVNGWKDESGCELFPFLKDYVEGVRKVICTDISCDGMLQGPSIALYKEILEHHPELYLIASGGVSCADDIRHLKLSAYLPLFSVRLCTKAASPSKNWKILLVER